MFRKFVCIATTALTGLAALAGPASAQYRNYDAGPNYFQSSPAYEPFTNERGYNERGYPRQRDEDRDAYYPDDRRGPAAYGYGRGGYGYDQGYGGSGEPAYPDSGYGGGPGRDAREASDMRTRTEVENPTKQPPGTIVVDTQSRHLYLVENGGRALEYGIGVGREGFEWKGLAHVQRKAEWPGWTPPAEMLKRRPDLPLHMEGGIENPLGARALYLYNGKGDTGFRIHGTNEPDTIGQAVSSGCIRMMNADVEDLYSRVRVGTKVSVL